MIFSNISLGKNVNIDPSTSVNNIVIGDNVKISKNCTLFGSPDGLLEIGAGSVIGMSTIIIGYAAKITIGDHASISQRVTVMSDSGPNASEVMQKMFPLVEKEIKIGNHCWIGVNAVIMPGVELGDYCVVAANSYVDKSFPPYSIIKGSPAKLITTMNHDWLQEI